MASRERSTAELGDGLDEVKRALEAVLLRLDSLPYVRTDLYTVAHESLRKEVVAEMARLKTEIDGVRAVASGARLMAWWAVGLFCTAAVTSLFAFVLAGGS